VVEATYFLETFGCQMNVLDSELVAGQLAELGLRRVDSPADAGLILFNTCSVRQHAEDKVLSRLGQLKRLKQRRPETVIGVLGCMAERMRADLFSQVPHLDLICGPGELHRLPELLAQAASNGRRASAVATSQSRRTKLAERAAESDPLEVLDLARHPRTGDNPLQAYIRVQRGCDKFCTYCVVPFTRGPERCRPPANIVAEAQRLIEAGCREITLLGQTVNSYLYPDAGEAVGLGCLLERMHALDGLDRIRFITSYPADWDEDIFRVMRDAPKVCPYLHIPAQSGSDRILKAMKRGYTAAEYLRLMDTARRYVPDIALAGDFIVGFCGETGEDFQATVDLVRRVEYKSIFVFKYSPRPGTPAERIKDDDVPPEVKARRNNELLAVQSEISLKHKRSLVGQTVDVLVEGYSKAARRARGGEAPESEDAESGIQASERQLVGRTPQDLIAVFDGEPEHVGALVRVRVASVSPLTLFGTIESVLSPAR
jgi:tRNA-2-methylthio-N6-dimethylallyladenosine synthase